MMFHSRVTLSRGTGFAKMRAVQPLLLILHLALHMIQYNRKKELYGSGIHMWNRGNIIEGRG
ncbi:MAG: hypothetical protein AUH89_05410 [Ktedonobacter sp. 13_1_40CM_4_52_4]|nr:MAG: hypothetical protein AUH89_05410 [Ktedonobacter sp. 13_1_40CM_4_52_4]